MWWRKWRQRHAATNGHTHAKLPLPTITAVPIEAPNESSSEEHVRKTIDLFETEESNIRNLVARLDESRKVLEAASARIQRVGGSDTPKEGT
jgi:hypothetical protein